MMRFHLMFLILLGSLSSLTGSSSAWAFDPTQNYLQPQFLPPQLLVPPPVEGSAQWQQQIDAVLRAQKNIQPVDRARIKKEQKLRVELLTQVLGPTFIRDQLPKTFELLDHVLAGTEQVSEADKIFWHTRRPYLTDPRVKLYVDPLDNSPSYPSGHTAGARVVAEVLGLLVPERLADLRARADEVAHDRIEAGAHYPCDIEGGRMLAMLVVGSLMANDDFQDDLLLARKEIEKK